jgi:hypothetical protein
MVLLWPARSGSTGRVGSDSSGIELVEKMRRSSVTE